MTREEAIEWLNTDISRLWNTPMNELHKEALDMAINALEQEPCDDCISRQAIDEIKELMTDINGDTVYAARMSDIRQLPPVTPAEKVGHWIDVDRIWFKCSGCGANRKMMPAYKEYYCPNCGAKMESEG